MMGDEYVRITVCKVYTRLVQCVQKHSRATWTRFSCKYKQDRKNYNSHKQTTSGAYTVLSVPLTLKTLELTTTSTPSRHPLSHGRLGLISNSPGVQKILNKL